MKSTIKREFPSTTIGMIDANGVDLTSRSKGVTVELHLRDGSPVCAEVYDTKTGGNNHHAEIGLIVEEGELIDYDGVFDLPKEVMSMCQELGVKNGLGI
jgi:hypothetical protein